jgi:4-amino-4-deoxy-L-arabinose transferase-like glycosyltransferase
MNETADLRNKPLTQGLFGSIPVRVEGLILGLLVLAALFIRVYRLGNFPDTVLADEADNYKSAAGILYGHPPGNGFFGLDWTDQPALSAYKEAAFLGIFGFNIMALRLSSALISSLALIPFYVLLRYQLSALSSFLASILLATDVWFLNFSRSGWNCIDIGFYMLMAMLFLVLALRTSGSASNKSWVAWIYFAGAGFFCALGLYGYPAGRAITLAVVAFFPILLIFYRKQFGRLLLGFIILFGVEAAAFAPEAVYIVRNWQLFTGRTNVVLILNNPEYQANPVGTMFHQLSNNLQGPWDGPVNNTPQYSPGGEPQLDGFTGILVLIGMILTFVDYKVRRQPETWLWWLMLLSGWALTQLTTVDTPNGARGIGYMPTLVYFAGVGLEMIVTDVAHMTAGGKWPILSSRLSGVLLALAVLVAGYFNVKHYVDWQNSPQTRTARYLYVTAREFPIWAADVENRIKSNRDTINVGIWREMHPIADIANPYGDTP